MYRQKQFCISAETLIALESCKISNITTKAFTAGRFIFAYFVKLYFYGITTNIAYYSLIKEKMRFVAQYGKFV